MYPELPTDLVNLQSRTICIDQGADGWTATCVLLYAMCCNLLVVPDMAHRIWNDTKGALRTCKLMGLVWLANVCFNFEHGPWSDKRWYRTAQEGAELYTSHVDRSEDALWRA